MATCFSTAIGENCSCLRTSTLRAPLSITTFVAASRSPPNFENAEDFGKTVTAINLQSISKNRVRVELDGVGFLATPAFDTLLKKFKYGDSWTLEHLKRAAEQGPVNWAEEERSDPPKQSK